MGQALLRLEGRVGKGRQYLLFGKDKEKPSTLAGLFLGLSAERLRPVGYMVAELSFKLTFFLQLG